MTHIGASIVITGELVSDEDIVIDGQLQGHIHVRDATVTIGEHARVEADVRGARVVVRGKVDGNLTAGERIELASTADVRGSLSANQVVIIEGATFNGTIDMHKRTIAAKMAQHRAGQALAG